MIQTKSYLSVFFIALFSIAMPKQGAAQFKIPNVFKSKTTDTTKIKKQENLSTSEISSGLKAALSQGLEASVKNLSAKDGFLGNEAVKILLPPQAQKADKALRSIGMGMVADNLITSLNRAAEAAVSEAAPVFGNALSKLTITDASKILLGGQENAATDFFKRTTTSDLTSKFAPIIGDNLNKFDVSKYWTAFVTRYNQIPLVKDKMETDLNAYVTQKAIDGLFFQVAQEELKIRNNLGGSRTTSLIQKVFGAADKTK